MARSASGQRAVILDAAVRVFAGAGLDGATIRRIGREARANSALMYYYFENKETLFAEAIRFVLQEFFDRLSAGRREFRGAEERLGYLVDAVFQYYGEFPERMRLMARALLMDPGRLAGVIGGFFRAGAVVPLLVLQEGVERGELRKIHPIHAWLSIAGLCTFSLFTQDVVPRLKFLAADLPPLTLEDRRREIVALLVKGLASKETGVVRKRRSVKP